MPDLPADPYRLYADWRRNGAVYWASPPGHWFVLSYSEVRSALSDPRLVSPAGDAGLLRLPDAGQFRPQLARTASDLLGRAGGEMDAIGDYAAPLARAAASLLLGVPAGDTTLNTWVDRLEGRLAAPLGHCRYLDSGESRRVEVPPDVADVLRGHCATQDPQRLAELAVAIRHSTAAVVGNGIRALLEHPAQYRLLHETPGLIGTAVQELLRYDPPVQMVARRAATRVALGGEVIEAGQMAMVVLAAANRDPDVFPAPGVLDLSRDPNPHLAFGAGPRYCAGDFVAELAAEVAIGELAARFPGLHGDGDPIPGRVIGGRSLHSLPIALSPGRRSTFVRVIRTIKAMHGMPMDSSGGTGAS